MTAHCRNITPLIAHEEESWRTRILTVTEALSRLSGPTEAFRQVASAFLAMIDAICVAEDERAELQLNLFQVTGKYKLSLLATHLRDALSSSDTASEVLHALSELHQQMDYPGPQGEVVRLTHIVKAEIQAERLITEQKREYYLTILEVEAARIATIRKLKAYKASAGADKTLKIAELLKLNRSFQNQRPDSN